MKGKKILNLADRYENIYKRKLLVEKMKGGQFLDAGCIYAPYIPIADVHMGDFATVKEAVSRYSRVNINHDFYGNINIDGLGV